MTSLYQLFVFLLAFYVAVIDGRYFRNDYEYHAEADGWLKMHPMPAAWDDARLRCFFEGGVLASPLNKKLLSTMKTTMGKTQAVFTGIAVDYSHGDFFSIEGVSLDNIHKVWSSGEPSNSGEENCISMLANGSLSTVSCNKSLPYICYKKNSQDMPSVNQCGTVDPDYVFEEATGHCYKFHRFGQTWSKASMACSAEGGYLAVINSDEEAQVLKKLMAKYPSSKILSKLKDFIAVGFHDWSQHGIFMTIHGQTLKEAGYEKWAAGQPDNAGSGEYCGSITRDASLNDIWCHETLPFICEKQPGSLLDNESGEAEEAGFLLATAADNNFLT